MLSISIKIKVVKVILTMLTNELSN